MSACAKKVDPPVGLIFCLMAFVDILLLRFDLQRGIAGVGSSLIRK
jgi:hypothetical protein